MGIVHPLASVRRFRLISPELAHFRDAESPCYRHSIAEVRRLSLLNCEQGQYKCRVGNMIPVAARMGMERRRRAQTAELGCGRPLPRSPRVPCDPPGCGSGLWLRLRACRCCCLVAVAQRVGVCLAPYGRFSAVPSERLLISSFSRGCAMVAAPFSLLCRTVLATTARWYRYDRCHFARR